MLGDRYCRAAWLGDAAVAPPGYVFRGLRSLFGNAGDSIVAIAGRARQIVEWARIDANLPG